MSNPTAGIPAAEQGFSLIEILIALLIAVTGFLTAGQLLYAVVITATIARSQETTVLAAYNTLEDLSALYLGDPTHEDLSPGDHGPKTVTVSNPLEDTVIHQHSIIWSSEDLPDPRSDKKHAAIALRVTARPVYTDNTPVNIPRSSGPVILNAVLGPGMP